MSARLLGETLNTPTKKAFAGLLGFPVSIFAGSLLVIAGHKLWVRGLLSTTNAELAAVAIQILVVASFLVCLYLIVQGVREHRRTA